MSRTRPWIRAAPAARAAPFRMQRVAQRATAAQQMRQGQFQARRVMRQSFAGARRMRARNVVTAGLLGVEKKFYDTARALTTISNTAGCATGEFDPTLNSGGASVPGCLNCPAQGDGAQNRDGKRIVMKYLVIHGNIELPDADAAGNQESKKVFVAVVHDAQTNGVQLNSEDVFSNISGELSNTTNPMRNLTYGSRFRVLKSETFDLDRKTFAINGANFSAAGQSVQFEWYIPLNDMIVNFTSTSTTSDVAGIMDNSLHLIAFSQYNTSASACQISYQARLRFVG